MKFRLFLLTTILLFSSDLFANWGEFHVGSSATGNIKPENTEQVILVDENLNIELFETYAVVTVAYLFQNTGKSVTVTAGFPTAALEYNKYRKRNEVTNYKIIDDGKEIPFKFVVGETTKRFPNYSFSEPAVNEDGRLTDEIIQDPIRINWLISSIHFKKDEIKKINISYISQYQMAGGGLSDDIDYKPHVFRYLLSTGNIWKGPIRYLKIAVHAIGLNPDKLIFRGNSKFIRKNYNSFVSEISNLEPTESDDIEINMNNSYSEKHGYTANGIHKYFVYSNNIFTEFKYTAESSSKLKSNDDRYSIEGISDGDLRTAWVEGKKDDGIGESITLSSIKGNPNQIAIFPGYGKSYNLYYANNRVAEIEVHINDKDSFATTLEDKLLPMHFISLPESEEEVKKIRLIIKKVYKGKEYRDTAISEISIRRHFSEMPNIRGPR